jgi:two-component system, NarL family, sensor histidine kinase UhpB
LQAVIIPGDYAIEDAWRLWQHFPILARMLPENDLLPIIGAHIGGRHIMPLRMRLIALVGLVLMLSLAGGTVLITWHAAKSVRTELRAAMIVGVQSVHTGFADHADPYQLVVTFDGNRHVRAMLVDAAARPLAASTLYVPRQPSPDWFRRLIAYDADTVRLAVPYANSIVVLQTDPTNEMSEVWADSRDTALLLAVFAILSGLATSLVVGQALRPLARLSTAFRRIGEGKFHGKIPEHGSPELVRLAGGFNLMAQQLATMAAQNDRLNERLLTLQAEERADVARDLHDEVGPLLFAIDMTAAAIERGADIPSHVTALHEAVGHIQRHVRALLERLRPLETVGLEVAIERLVAFWHDRRPGIDFIVTVSVDEDKISEPIKETIYRVVQEAMSNAIRHGKPTRLEIGLTDDGDGGIRIAVTDDGVGMPLQAVVERDQMQFGLAGMRERVMAMAGSLSIMPGQLGKGVTLIAQLPLATCDREELE